MPQFEYLPNCHYNNKTSDLNKNRDTIKKKRTQFASWHTSTANLLTSKHSTNNNINTSQSLFFLLLLFCLMLQTKPASD